MTEFMTGESHPIKHYLQAMLGGKKHKPTNLTGVIPIATSSITSTLTCNTNARD